MIKGCSIELPRQGEERIECQEGGKGGEYEQQTVTGGRENGEKGRKGKRH